MKRHIGKAVAFLLGAVLLGVNLMYQGPAADARAFLRIASNAALVPGILLAGIGGILRISEEGLFDGIRYTVSTLVLRMLGMQTRYESYYAFTQRQRRESAASALLIPGLVYLAAAAVMTLLYYA